MNKIVDIRPDAEAELNNLAMSESAKPLMEAVKRHIAENVEPITEEFFRLGENRADRWSWAPGQLELLQTAKDKAKASGLWNFFLPDSEIGRGLTNLDYAYIAVELGKNRLASECLNCSAPDTGNMEVIERVGAPEQKAQWLEPLLEGKIRSAYAMTEPGIMSSDARQIQTKAELDGDEWVINGSKMWTSLIESADYVWLAARTNPDAPKHKGISVFLVPTSSEGFSFSPVRTLSGATTSQTFYDDVRVPKSALVGELNQGWRLVTGQLNRERVALCSPAGVQTALAETRRWAQQTTLPDGSRVIDQEWVQANLGKVHAKVEFLKLINWKIAWGVGKGISPADASATKVFGTEFSTEAYRLLMECFGDEAFVRAGSPGSALKGRLERAYRGSLILTFGGGTNEIQRDIIAMVGMGMPRAPR